MPRADWTNPADLKYAIVHDRFAGAYTGSEKVVEGISEVFPSDIYSLVADRSILDGTKFQDVKITTSFIQKMPMGSKWYQLYLPLYPLAVEQLDVADYDVVISSSHTVAKGILTRPDQLHICYCHTPMRYIWDLYFDYLRDSGLERGIRSKIVRMIFHYLRMWDMTTVPRVDFFIANSMHVARRIKKLYNRDSSVIYPPVDVDSFSVVGKKEGFFLAASRLVQYKKMDLIVEAFSMMPQERLVVIGDGPDMQKIKRKAAANIEIIGYQESDVLIDYMQRAKAFVFAANEDFGIIPVEAQACGTPVIAYGRGGVTETVLDGKTGVLFDRQTPGTIVDAVSRFRQQESIMDPGIIRRNAERFSKQRFKSELKGFVENCVHEFNGQPSAQSPLGSSDHKTT